MSEFIFYNFCFWNTFLIYIEYLIYNSKYNYDTEYKS